MAVSATNTEPSRLVETPLRWDVPDKGIGYRCEIRIRQEADGFVSYVPSLKGVVSQGDDTQSAVKNITEALQGVISTYLNEGMEIPWEKPEAPKKDEVCFWIVVKGG
ncbi:MAG: type II toxin-antitoxin system HicB family antitoxin [Phycisphaerales bacterium]|nr:type II toxin-antitoxin system HicB family antitoxin [Phycisphaerales bacterium]